VTQNYGVELRKNIPETPVFDKPSDGCPSRALITKPHHGAPRIGDEAYENTPISEDVRAALDAADGARFDTLLDSVALSEALHEVLSFSPAGRDAPIALLSPELTSQLIDEAPPELAGEMIVSQEPAKAVEIFDDLDSDAQADAILAGLVPEDAARVRRLAEYDAGTAGVLTLANAFQFHPNQTVGVVPLRRKRVRQNPAVVSGPLLRIITDMAGFFLVLSLASLMMPLLVQ